MASSNLRIGDKAPEFFGTFGRNEIRSSDFLGKKNVVLFFYPKDFSPGCTAEACSFRDAYDEFRSKDTEIIGVSMDTSESHDRFAQKHSLSFPLIADPKGLLAERFDAIGTMGKLLGVSRRVTVVIDKQGIIQGIFRHELAVMRHLDDVRQAIQRCS
jgi:peroxiredoxin Q/BCP